MPRSGPAFVLTLVLSTWLHVGCQPTAHRQPAGAEPLSVPTTTGTPGTSRASAPGPAAAPREQVGPVQIFIGDGVVRRRDGDAADAAPEELPTAASVRDRPAAGWSRFRVLHAAFSPEDQARVDRNCLMGLPKRNPQFGHGPTRFVCRDGYVLEHASADKIPIWVSERVTRGQLAGSLPRTNPFQPDPLLPSAERSELSDYRRSGFDRGHMAPNGNQTLDDRLRRETFFLSNIVPQNGSQNQGIWARLEGQCRSWVHSRYPEAYVITGGMFYDPAEEDESTADGLIEFQQIGANAVSVPTHTYKIFVGKAQDGTLRAVAFMIENAPEDRDAPFDGFKQDGFGFTFSAHWYVK